MEVPEVRLRQKLREPDRDIQPFDNALRYFKNVSAKIPVKGNSLLLQHLTVIETTGLSIGIPADGIDILLRLALSGNLVDPVNIRILKSLIPATEILEDTLIAAVSLFSTCKTSTRTQILFLQWLISVYDLLPCKKSLASLYNFFFCLLPDDRLCPSLCHLLYLLTEREHVLVYRVRGLLELQSRKGLQLHILGLLSIYKVFCPELVSVSLPRTVKIYFKNSKPLFAAELKAVLKRKTDPFIGCRLNVQETNSLSKWSNKKRKWNSNLYVPVCSSSLLNNDLAEESVFSSKTKTFPVEKLQTFSQLLENILKFELPTQMACVLKCPLLLNYINCTKEENSLLRLNYWLAFTLHEECAWFNGKQTCEEEVSSFLDDIVTTQEFLQEGLSGSEDFLYKCLQRWNGCHGSQILGLISWIPLYSFPEIEGHLCETVAQLFVPSPLYFKIDVLKCFTELLRNWMVEHSCCLENAAMKNDTMSGLMTSVENLIQFSGNLCTISLQIDNNPLLLHVILDFYTVVSDSYVCFSLPLIVLPPPGVFYSALLCPDCVNLNKLCYIMNRYRVNLLTARREEQQKVAQVLLSIHSQTFKLYNQYLIAMVGCLWTSQAFCVDSHPQSIRMGPEVLQKSGVPSFKKKFNIVFHPALRTFSAFFLQTTLSEDKMFLLHLLKGQQWDDYIEFLCHKGMTDLDLFLKNSVNRISAKKKAKSIIKS